MPNDGPRSEKVAIASAVARRFDFHGPSETIDTARFSSLAALHQACSSLRNGTCSLALAGGASDILTPDAIANETPTSPAIDGRTDPSNGSAIDSTVLPQKSQGDFARGEGVGWMLLKPLSRALADGDRIYAAILGTASANGNGKTADPGETRKAAWLEACQQARVEPARVAYVETDDGCDPLCDPVLDPRSAAVLGEAIGQSRASERPLLLGSVRANVGHLGAAAGVAASIEMAIALHRRQVPPNANFSNANAKIPFASLRLRAPQKLEMLEESPCLAGIGAFGADGSSNFAILTSVEPQATKTSISTDLSDALETSNVPEAKGDLTGERDVYEYRWVWQPTPEQSVGEVFPDGNRANFVPSPRTLGKLLKPAIAQVWRNGDRKQYDEAIAPQANAICAAYAIEAFAELGFPLTPGRCFSEEEAIAGLGIDGDRRAFAMRLLQRLEEEGYLRSRDGVWEVASLPEGEARSRWKSLFEKHPSYTAELLLLERCGRNLPAALRGVAAIEERTVDFARDRLHQDSLASRPYNFLIREAIARIADGLPPGRKLRVLAVGAETNGTTAWVLPQLDPERSEYAIAAALPQGLQQARQQFGKYPFVRYGTLDLEGEAIAREEGDTSAPKFEAGSFDVVLAVRAGATTRDPRRALETLKSLLADVGMLLLLEATAPTFWMDWVFALPPDRPLLSWQDWQSLLIDGGFREVAGIGDRAGSEQTLVLAQAAKATDTPQEEPDRRAPSQAADDSSAGDRAGAWVLLEVLSGDRSHLGRELAAALQDAGGRTVFAAPGMAFDRVDETEFRLPFDDIEAMRRFLEIAAAEFAPCRGIVLLADAEAREAAGRQEIVSRTSAIASTLLQALPKVAWQPTPRLWYVTRNAQAIDARERPDPFLASLWGVGRAASEELEAFDCACVDLGRSPVKDIDGAIATDQDELQQLLALLGRGDAEKEIALRGKNRYVRRLARLPLAGWSANPTGRSLRQRPDAGEVEIEMRAMGCSGLDSNFDLGYCEGFIECAGVVTATGADVRELGAGDAVVALATRRYGRYAIADARWVARKPERFSFAEAATIPVAFLTARVALHEAGRLQRGERVLVRAAAGDVGLAALQLARLAGAEVFATATGEEEQAVLRSLGVPCAVDSRSPDFVEAVWEATDGEGVDLVSNFLEDDAIATNLSLLAPYGRWVEVARQNRDRDFSLGLQPFQKNLTFVAANFEGWLRDRPRLLQQRWQQLWQQFAREELHPLPHHAFPIERAPDILERASAEPPFGKLVGLWEDAAIAPNDPSGNFSGRLAEAFDGTILIAGKLAGWGLVTAGWLAEKGARSLMLVDPEGFEGAEATASNEFALAAATEAAIARMRSAGARVTIARANLVRARDVRQLLERIRENLPPLRGVAIAANIGEGISPTDSHRENQKRAIASEVWGAWHLHEQTRDLPLAFFATAAGSARPKDAVARAFLATLASYRRSLGLPGLAIDWEAGTGTGDLQCLEVLSPHGASYILVAPAERRSRFSKPANETISTAAANGSAGKNGAIARQNAAGIAGSAIESHRNANGRAPVPDCVATNSMASASPNAESTAIASSESSIVALQPQGKNPPFFCVHPATGGVFPYLPLATALGTEQPFYGIQDISSTENGTGETLPQTDRARSIEEIAASYLAAARAVQPQGPYYLGGACFGAPIALEMARQLEKRGERVALLAVFDTVAPAVGKMESLLCFLGSTARQIFPYLANFSRPSQNAAASLSLQAPDAGRMLRAAWKNGRALVDYTPEIYRGRAVVFRSEGHFGWWRSRGALGWEVLAKGGTLVRRVAGKGILLRSQHASAMAVELAAVLQQARAGELLE